MASGSSALPSRPMNVEQIVKAAQERYFDSEYSLQQWLRTATLMQKHAAIYEHEGNYQLAYYLLYRHADLVLDKILTLAAAKAPEHRQALKEARKDVAKNISKMEDIKPRINARFERYQAKLRDREQKMDQAKNAAETTRSYSPDMMNPDLFSDQAVEWANQEIGRRVQLSRGTSHATDAAQDLPARIREARRLMDQRSNRSPQNYAPSLPESSFHYPRVAQRTVIQQPRPTSLPQPDIQPPRPPKQSISEGEPQGPSRPAKVLIDRTASPEQVQQFAASSRLESGEPLRTIFLPSPLRHDFLRIAESNTTRNLETCGILCGTLIRNAFFISKLVIPEQTSTSDTCEMINEAALHAYIESFSGTEELMMLGWIHTHPSQTCFLSSRDLHTHVWYQASLPESIAVVCAPSKRAPEDFGVFRLTDPSGMQVLRKCERPGIFHPHDDVTGGIYTDVLGRPGHVREHPALAYEVVDLR